MLAGTAEVFTVTVPAWILAALAFLGTVLGGAISFAVNQLLIKGAADRAAKKREKEDEQRRERYILQMDSRKATFDLLSCICAGIERMETETGQIYWNGELKRCLSHLEGVDERYRESDQRHLAELNTRNKRQHPRHLSDEKSKQVTGVFFAFYAIKNHKIRDNLTIP